MEGRVEGPDGRRQAVHHLEKPRKVAFLHGEELRERYFSALKVFGDDHLPHRVDARPLEEHVLGPAEADAFSPEGDGDFCLVGLICVCPHTETPRLVGPLHEGVEVLVDTRFLGFQGLVDEDAQHFRGDGLHLSREYFAGAPVYRDVVALLDGKTLDLDRFCPVVDVESPQPATQTFPICRATRAAWLVIRPWP